MVTHGHHSLILISSSRRYILRVVVRSTRWEEDLGEHKGLYAVSMLGCWRNRVVD